MDSINRTFVGVRVPPELLPDVDRALLMLKRKPGILDMRWNTTAEYLVNMVTLGELSVATISRLSEAISRVTSEYSAFEVILEKFVGLPNMIQPRFAVLQLAGPGADTLVKMAGELDVATRLLTPPREGRPFQANVVMGRIKTESEQGRVALGRALKFPEHEPFGVWPITQIELLISTSSMSGVGYKAIETFPLR